MTENKLLKLTATWKKFLRMLDWDITVRYAQVGEIESDCHGYATGDYKMRKGYIVINHPTYLSPDSLLAPDIEITLVHELLHLKFESLMKDGSETDEGNIEDLANLLVTLKRQVDDLKKVTKKK
jgi:hypothetical protein